MYPWKVSGEHSNRNWSITVITQADRRQFEILQSISRSSITGSADRPGLASCHPQLMNKGSMQERCQHKRFGVHYCHPTSVHPPLLGIALMLAMIKVPADGSVSHLLC